MLFGGKNDSSFLQFNTIFHYEQSKDHFKLFLKINTFTDYNRKICPVLL